MKNRKIKLPSPPQAAGELSPPCRAQGEARRAARLGARAKGLLLPCRCSQGRIITLSSYYRASLHRLSRRTSTPPCPIPSVCLEGLSLLALRARLALPSAPAPLKAVPRRAARPRARWAGTAGLPGCGTALPLPPDRCGCGPGAGNTPPFGWGRGGSETCLHPSPVWESSWSCAASRSRGMRSKAECWLAWSASRTRAGVKHPNALIRLCPCEISFHVTPAVAAESGYLLEGHAGVKPHRKPSPCKPSVTRPVTYSWNKPSRGTKHLCPSLRHQL